MTGVPEPRKPRSWSSPTLRRLGRRVVRFGVPVLGLIALAVTCGVERKSERCLSCDSTRETVRRGLGTPYRIVVPTWPKSVVVQESAALRIAYSGQHSHQWRQDASSREGLWGFHSGGAGARRTLAVHFNQDPHLQAWVKSEIASGVMTLERLQVLLEVPGPHESAVPPAAAERNAALRREIRALLRRYRSAQLQRPQR